jgi:hypothetical protein
MKVEIDRFDLLNMIRSTVTEFDALAKNINTRHPGSVEHIPFLNGSRYRLCESWAKEQTDHELFIFYKLYSPSIKLIEP